MTDRRRIGTWLVVLSVAAAESPVWGQSSSTGGSLVIKARRVMPVTAEGPWIIDDGVVVIRDGVIVGIGEAGKVAPPPDLPVVEYRDETLLPGLVAASSDLVSAHRADEAVSGGFRAVDAFDVYGDYRLILSGGVTTVHLDSGHHRLIAGIGAVVRLGGPPKARVLREASNLDINFGDAARRPPPLQEYIFPASSDQAIQPAQRQRPDSRLGLLPGFNEALESALDVPTTAPFDYHRITLSEAIRAGMPMRIRADRAADLALAARVLAERKGVLVSGGEVGAVADDLRRLNIPLIYEVDLPLRRPSGNIGVDPEALEPDVGLLSRLDSVTVALSAAAGQPLSQLRLLAMTAQRAGFSERRAIEGITRTAAEILGVADRVGSLAPGKDADIVVIAGDPLETTARVRRVYIRGESVLEPPMEDSSARRADSPTGWTGPLVIRAGTIWVSPERRIANGSVLIEDGRIAAVGHRVPVPPFARIIDAGPEGVVTPGFIDALGHLGLRGDSGSLPPEARLSRIIGAADVPDLRVARAGVTTVSLTPYRSPATTGVQLCAVKTAGTTRDQRVVRDPAGVWFDVRTMDYDQAREELKNRLDAGRKYLETWKKYEKDLKEWEEKRKSGQANDATPATQEQTSKGEEDPLTGTWQGTVSGAPLPSPQTGKIAVRLTGNTFEGRVVDPPVSIEHKIVGTFDGKALTGRIEIDTGGQGYPEFEGTLDKPDHITGTIRFMSFTVSVVGERIEKKPVEFKVTKTRTRGKDGRPLPPKVDEALEPLKALLEKKIPAVVAVSTHKQIETVVKLFVEDNQLLLTLAYAEEAEIHAAKLAEMKIGVILPPELIRTQRYLPYHQADVLSRRGVAVAFQSDAEDGARSLPSMAMYAVEHGMSADAALASLTTDAARMLGIDDRVGSLEPGRDGDVLIFDGPPLDPATRIRRVIIGGQEVD